MFKHKISCVPSTSSYFHDALPHHTHKRSIQQNKRTKVGLSKRMATAATLPMPATTNSALPRNDIAPIEVDVKAHPTAQKLVRCCRDFLSEVEDLTPGHELEAYLNKNYGPGHPVYEDLCKFTRQGLKEGWVANAELDGAKYRRSKILLPSAENRFFSITTVYMESEEEYSGPYHSHPYGEINFVVQLDPTAELKGMQGWQGAGWTSPGPGTHHYPQVRKGALIALFFLPAGRISYNAKPGDPQPQSI